MLHNTRRRFQLLISHFQSSLLRHFLSNKLGTYNKERVRGTTFFKYIESSLACLPCTSHLLPSDQLEANIHTRPAPASQAGPRCCSRANSRENCKNSFCLSAPPKPGPSPPRSQHWSTAAVRCPYCGAVLLAAPRVLLSIENILAANSKFEVTEKFAGRGTHYIDVKSGYRYS